LSAQKRRINIEDETLRRDIVVETMGSSRAHHQYELDELVLNVHCSRSRIAGWLRRKSERRGFTISQQLFEGDQPRRRRVRDRNSGSSSLFIPI